MEILKRENGNYLIASDGTHHVIAIVCGTSALFEVVVQLSEQQKNSILDNKTKLQDILDKIRLNPHTV
ncbi:MAG: hypothetical protein EOO52_01415 [Gammaproteobacteria bacterium]|nr:MAG: hypothetical protein EOO52_01415 [Gammaproteobacteria bacterium]